MWRHNSLGVNFRRSQAKARPCQLRFCGYSWAELKAGCVLTTSVLVLLIHGLELIYKLVNVLASSIFGRSVQFLVEEDLAVVKFCV